MCVSVSVSVLDTTAVQIESVLSELRQDHLSFHITLAFLGAESSMHWTVLLQDWYMEVDMGK